MKQLTRLILGNNYYIGFIMKYINNKSGFSLIELMIALAITSIVVGAATAVFSNLQTTSTEIDQRTSLAANARGAMFFIEDNIKMLGYNPMKDLSKNTIMRITRAGELEFLQNNEDQGQPDEIIHIGLAVGGDATANGIADAGSTSLVIRVTNTSTGTSFSGPVADEIAAIGFAYGFDDNDDGDVDTDATSNQIIWAVDSDGDGDLDTSLDTNFDGEVDGTDAAAAITPVQISKIRAVKVWLLARTKYPVRDGIDNTIYYVGANAVQPLDNFAYTMHTTGIRCRNMF